MGKTAPIEISRYLGINEAAGETEIEMGQATSQVNWRITQNYKPQKRAGHKTWINFGNSLDVQGMWEGTVGGKNLLVIVNGGKVYARDLDIVTTTTAIATLITEGAVTEIGTLADAKTTIFYFQSKIYFINGFEYKEYDGLTYQDVDPYIPTVATGSPPAGGGTPFESINLLSGRKKQNFIADGVTTAYQLAENNLDSDLLVAYVNGAKKTETTHFTVVRATGIVTFGVAPADELEVDIEWTKTEVDALLDNCETAWTETVAPGVTSTTSATYKSIGSFSEMLTCHPSAVLSNTILATNAISSADLSTFTHIRLWLRSDKTVVLGNLQLLLDNTPSCVSPLETLNIPALTLGVGTYVNIPLNNRDSDTAIISIGIKQVVDIGALTLYIDDIRAINLEGEETNKDLVLKNRFAMINGPGSDTAVFLWGNSSQKNRRSWSGTLKANYFPAINYTMVGSDEFAITDIKPQYDRQIIFKEDRTHFSYPEWNSTAEAWDYPVKDLNEKVGNAAYGQVQIVKNFPLCLHRQSWWYWSNTSIKDERNADPISEKLRQSLSELDFSTAITFDNQREKEYWMNVGDKVYIWNYGNDTMYIYDNISGTCFLDVDGFIYYGSQGTIERMEGLDDNGVAITSQLILGFKDWGSMELRKNSRELFASIIPYSQTSLNVYYKTNRLNEFKAISKIIEYRLLDFNNIDFNNYSFSTNRNPQTFRRKIRAKKYTYIQFMLENKELNETCVINSIKIQAETQGVER